MKIGEFTTKCNSSKKRVNYQKQDKHSLMSVKIGMCMAICLAVVLLNIFSAPLQQIINPTDNGIFVEENTEKSKLGKLRFVELPGLLEVFAGGDDLTVPIEFSEAYLDNTATKLTLKGDKGSMVTTCSDGIVKSVGTDESLGKYVVISHSGDIETTYFGFETVAVEYSQPIRKLDTLGLLSDSGELIILVNEGGSPKNPCDYLSIPTSKLMQNNMEKDKA